MPYFSNRIVTYIKSGTRIHSSCYFPKHLAFCNLKISLLIEHEFLKLTDRTALSSLGDWIYVALMKGGGRMEVFLILQIFFKGMGYFLNVNSVYFYLRLNILVFGLPWWLSQ